MFYKIHTTIIVIIINIIIINIISISIHFVFIYLLYLTKHHQILNASSAGTLVARKTLKLPVPMVNQRYMCSNDVLKL